MRVTAKTELKWIIVGLWVLAACAGRSTRSKGSQQTLRLSHPVRVARKPAKNDFSGFRAGDRAGWPRTRPEGAGAGNLAGSLGQAQKASGPWNLPGWGPRPPGGTPQTLKTAKNVCRPSKLPKMFVLATFREHWRGRPRRTGAGGPGSLDSASLGPQTPLKGTPHTPKMPKMYVLRVAPRTGPEGPGSLESASLGPQTPLGVPPQTPQKKHDALNGRGFGVHLYCLTARGQ